MAPKQRGVAHVRLSADEEKALSRIVGRIASKSSSSGGEIVDKKQAEKKLRKIYDSLGNEGFTADQIELALAAISLSNATLESALDWLCLNIHPNDLPLKFSTGFTVDDKAGSVQVLASSQGDSKKSSEKIRKKSDFSNLLQLDAKDKRKKSNDNTDKDWIRQYVAQQEEDDEEDSQSDLSDWEEHVDGKFKIDPLDTAEKIAAAFFTAKQAAVEAKSRGDKQRQADAGKTIRDLKEKMLLLGLSEDDLVFPAESPDTSNDSPIEDQTDTVADHDSDNEQTLPDQNVADQKPDQNVGDQKPDQNVADKKPDQNEADQKPAGDKVDEDEDDLIGMFDEESAQTENIPQLVPQLPKKEKIKPWGAKEVRGGKTKLKTASIEAQKSPRAVLQQYCQKNGWEAPKFEKIPAKHGAYNYAITIFRPKVGRGKQKKIGGPATYSFPDDDLFSSISEAQDAAATWTLFSLFPQEPIHLELMEPFRSMWLRWHSQGKLPTEANSESRDDFIRSILDAEKPETSSLDDVVSTSESVAETLQAPATSIEHKNLKENYDHSASARLKVMLDSKVKDRRYQAMLSTRRQLPIASVKETILENLITSNVLVVSGETGSGKTTQVPQFILDDMIAARQGGSCKIICTQPRRIAAISVAERVANERCEPAPGEAGSTVGYQVRLDASWTNETRLLFCTTGILLRRLASDRELSDVSHVVVDEVHERTVLGDFLISLLRDLVAKRNQDKLNPLKVILMSATLDANRFSQYFGDCPVVVATGRSYPVKTFYLEDIYEKLDYRLSNDNPAAMQQSYSSHDKKSSQSVIDKNRGRQNLALSGWGDEQILESRLINPMYDESLYQNYSENTRKNLAKLNEDVIDYELLEDLIMHINETGDPGALLVFLPGMPEILQLLDRLTVLKTFSGPASEWLLPLHSSVAPADQRKVFQVPRNGIRKIVLATNIAETSVTIEDVVHVIDCGKHKENRFDPRRRMSRMVEAWISQANARQRAGRAGRVKAGNCFCLYTQYRFSNQMHPFQLPEILRVPLVELCLQIKLLSVENVASFLEKALDPPKPEAVESALSILREVGALTEEESLTPLGCHLAALPVDVHIGKMMLYGALLGCLSPILTIAAYLSHKSPFVAPLGQRDAAERAKHGFGDAAAEKSTIASGRQSDHLVIVAAYENWRRISSQGSSRAARQYCDANFLSIPVLNMLKEMRLQFAKLLKDIGFISKIDHQTLDRSLDDANQQFNLNAQSASVVKAVLCAGLYPNVATMMEESVKAGHANALNQRAGLASQRTPRWTDGRREVFVHPSSINSKAKEFQHPYLVFHEKVETSKVYLRDTTVLSPFALLLFGGSLKVQHQVGYATVDDWMKMDVPARTAVLFKELRSSLDSLLSELTKTPQERTIVGACKGGCELGTPPSCSDGTGCGMDPVSILHGGIVVTMDGNRNVYACGGVAIQANRIIAVGESEAILDKFAGAAVDIVDLSGRLIMPGLINTHVHTSQQLGRGIADDVDLLTWLHKRIWPYESNMTDNDSYLSTLLCGIELIRSGVTCFAEAGGQHVPAMARAVEKLGIRACLTRSTMDSGEGLPDSWAAETTESCLEAQEELYENLNGSAGGRIRVWFGLRQIMNATDALLLRTKEAADKHKTGIHMHVAEIAYENEHVIKTRNVENGTVTHLEKIGVLGDNLLAAHSVWISDTEVTMMSKAGVKVSHCPASAMRMLGFCPVQEMLQQGVCVSIGTDGAPSNNRMSMVDEMYLASLINKGKLAFTTGATDPTALPAETVLEMATINGARSVLWDNEIGSLEVGKKADLIVINPQTWSMIPLHDPISSLVYSMRSENIESVMCDGVWIMRNRKILTIDEAVVLKDAAPAAEDLIKRAGIQLPKKMNVISR